MEVMGMLVYYCFVGEGLVLLFLYGIGVIFYIWEGWIVELWDFFWVISVILFVFGFIGLCLDEDYFIFVYVDFVEVFVKKVGLEWFYLVGNLLGGLIVWEYVLVYLECV